MGFRLHIWGPAFGLPSIDAECIAAVVYFNRIVPHGEWTLVADNNPSIGPRKEFPVLFENDIVVTGFASIVTHLRNHHSGAYDLDHSLTHKQQADKTAFFAFVQSVAVPIVDLSLYISSENYNTTTSSAYTAILPWHANYIIPPARRNEARARTAHLGLSSLDVQEANEDEKPLGGSTASSEYDAAKRSAGLLTDGGSKVFNMGHGRGVKGLLSRPVYAARFRLDSISNELLEPLSDLLGNKTYLLKGDKPSSLDCLAFGYLALMLYPAVPQDWLKHIIQTKHPRMYRYIQRLREEFVGKDDINAALIWKLTSGKPISSEPALSLPWTKQSHIGIFFKIRRIIGHAVRSLPLVSMIVSSRPTVYDSASEDLRRKHSSLLSPHWLNFLLALSTTVIAGFTGFALHRRRNPREGDLIFWALRPANLINNLGAESFLSVFANQLHASSSSPF